VREGTAWILYFFRSSGKCFHEKSPFRPKHF
jgi:hypothetical protein